MPGQNSALLTHRCRGTQSYRAPELVLHPGERRYFSEAVDVWAMGCIFYEIIYREKAFKLELEINQFCESNRASFSFPIRPAEGFISTSTQSFFSRLIKEMLEIVPSKRPAAAAILTFLTKVRLSDFK
jgi:serine/threonine protein kinase